MNLPNLKEAKIRSNKEVKTIKASNIKSNNFKNKKFYIRTYGCQMNVHDSEEIKGILTNLGFTDLIAINTCAIRENAHDKVFGFLGRIKHLKREKPDLIVCVGGCMPELESVTNLLKEKYPFVNIVFGTHNINDLGRMILDYTNKVPELMSISDLVITKPGGLTTTESLASGLPIIVINPIPGQEEENAQFLEDNGLAIWIKKDDNIKEVLTNLFSHPEKMKEMKIRARIFAKKHSTKDICKIIFNY